jgi:tRNA pseudouridine55 synthase
MNHNKIYLFELTFGEFRTTYDFEGEIIEKNSFIPTADTIKNILDKFIGTIKQTPPLYSAIKINGKRACDLARNGEKVELKSREVKVHNITFNGFVSNNTINFTVKCGRGCYIRSLGVDIAKSVGAIAYVSKIERLKVGDFSIENALGIDKIDLLTIKNDLIFI